MISVLTGKRFRTWAGTAVVLVFLAGIVVLGADRAHQAPLVRLHGGAAWLASNKVGQLTLLDGSSAEVAARVAVATPGNPVSASQFGSSGYALNRWDGTVVRVDGATQQPGRPMSPLAASGDQLTTFPTAHTLYVLDSRRGLLAPVDPVTLAPRGTPQSLAAQVTPESSAVDDDGRLWVLDQRSGDLVWFAGDVRQARTHAGTPDQTRLNLTAGQPALLDLTRRVAELIDSQSGEVLETVQVDLRPLDKVAVSGSPQQRRLLVSVASRGLLMVCTFGADSCAAPVPLGSGGGDFGAPIETNNHAIVPDYATGRVWIVNLTTMQVVVERQLFPGPMRFDLLSRDGVVFYNNPDGDQAGVLDLDGRVRAVSKYNPADPAKVHPTQVADSQATARQIPQNPVSTAAAPPVAGPGPGVPDPPTAPRTSIVVKPRDRGVVGEEFELSVVASGSTGLTATRWNFGDGLEASGQTVRHRWDRPGAFQVNVAATFANGQPAPGATATVVIEPGGAPPLISRINLRPEIPQAGQPAWFSAELTGTQPDQWEWSITGQGGSVASSNRPQFQHTFSAPGAYTATLTVRAGNERVQQTRQFTVAPAPPSVRCGDVLTASATLTGDLVCPGNVAVTIAASNVVLDLGGHTIRTPATTFKDTGIMVKGSAPITNVTIQNGRVMHFETGISLSGVTGATAANLTLLSASEGGSGKPDDGTDIRADRSRDIRLDTVSLTGAWAFVADNESTLLATRSIIDYHTLPTRPISSGLCAHGSSCTLVDSTVRMYNLTCRVDQEQEDPRSSVTIDNSTNLSTRAVSCYSVTIRNNRSDPIEASATGTLTFTRNTVANSLVNNFTSKASTNGPVSVSENTFTGLPGGFYVRGTGVVSGNTFTGNQYAGLSLGPSFSGEQSGPLEVTRNIFRNNGDGPTPLPNERGGLIIRSAPGSPPITVSNNHTEQNKVYGIWSSGNVVNGGGNTSSGDEVSCFGPVC